MAYTITQKELAEENMIFSEENQGNVHPANKIRVRTERGRLNVINQNLCIAADKGLNYSIIEFELTPCEKTMLKVAGYILESKQNKDIIKW